jgi:hypothetical protein
MERISSPLPPEPLYKTIFSNDKKKKPPRSIYERLEGIFPILTWLPSYPKSLLVLLLILIIEGKLERRYRSRPYNSRDRDSTDTLIRKSGFDSTYIWYFSSIMRRSLFCNYSTIYLCCIRDVQGSFSWNCRHKRLDRHKHDFSSC